MQPLTTVRSIVLLVIVSHSVAMVAYAQSVDDELGFKLGETDLFPSVRIDYLQNSNAFLEQDDVISASDIIISPEFVWVADRRLVTLEGSYSGEYSVSSVEALNYADHFLAFTADAELSSKKEVSGEVNLEIGHLALGDYLTSAQADADSEEITFAELQADARYRYGADNAKGNVSLGLFLQNLNYTSREDVTSGSGYTRFEPHAEFSLRVSGDTRFLSQIRLGVLRYGNEVYDRNDLSLLAGMQFNATGKSGGTVRFGLVQSQRTWSEAQDQTEFIARASVFWEPASYSRFELDGYRELDNRGSSIVSADDLSSIEDYIRLRWLHTWSSRVSHVASLQSQNFTRACPDLDTNTLTASFEFNVQVTRWLSVGLNGNSATRDVPGCAGTDNAVPNQDYQRTRVGAHLRATL